MKKTLKEMYNLSKTVSSIKLLPTLNYSWWAEYTGNNVAVINKAFASRFASFTYEPLLDDPDDNSNFMADWIDDVTALFFKNAKKYEELYRIHTVSNNDLPINYNYDLHETMSKTTTDQSAVITGQRTDISNTEVGSQKQENVNKVSAFNSNAENTRDVQSSEVGSRNDINQFTKGQETDTTQGNGTENYTLDRKGNIGTQNAANIMDDFLDLVARPDFIFYNTIFDDICMELLQIGG